MVLIVLGLIAYSTTNEALPWFRKEGLGAVFSDNWNPGQNHFGALALLYGTFLVGFIALLIAVPISVGIALFVTEIAPYRVGRAIVYTVDLLAAIPSVVYGLWAVFVLIEPLAEIFADVSSTFDGVPILGAITASPSATGRSFLTAGIVVAIMITPIVTSLTREVFATTPTALKEAAYGLGSTKWEMIRGAVLPAQPGRRDRRGHDRPRSRDRRDHRHRAGDRLVEPHHRRDPRPRRHDGERDRQRVRRGQWHPPVGAHRPRCGAVRAHHPRGHGRSRHLGALRQASQAIAR